MQQTIRKVTMNKIYNGMAACHKGNGLGLSIIKQICEDAALTREYQFIAPHSLSSPGKNYFINFLNQPLLYGKPPCIIKSYSSSLF